MAMRIKRTLRATINEYPRATTRHNNGLHLLLYIALQ